MLAAAYVEPGDELPRLVELTPPRPGPGEVLVQVFAAEVEPWQSEPSRSEPSRSEPRPAVPGSGFAGLVVQLGPGAFGWERGDAVLGFGDPGAWAQYVAVDSAQLVGKPAAMAWPEACTLSGAGLAADLALAELDVRRGETVLLLGAAGGAGWLAVQLARALGARVLAVADRRHLARLRALGAVPVPPGRVRELAVGVDAVLDATGRADLAEVRDLWAESGRVARVSGVVDRTAHGRLPELVELWEAGGIRPEVAAVLPLAHAAEAWRLAAAGRARGSVVLAPWAAPARL